MGGLIFTAIYSFLVGFLVCITLRFGILIISYFYAGNIIDLSDDIREIEEVADAIDRMGKYFSHPVYYIKFIGFLKRRRDELKKLKEDKK